MRLHDDGTWSSEIVSDDDIPNPYAAMRLVPCSPNGPTYEEHPWRFALTQEQSDILGRYLGQSRQPNPMMF